MTEINIIDNMINKSINNNVKTIKSNVRDEKNKEKSFSNVLNECKSESSKPDKKIDAKTDKCKNSNEKGESIKLVDKEDLVDKTSENNDELSKILVLLQALIEGKLSVKEFMDKVKSDSNGQEMLKVLVNSIKNINSTKGSNAETDKGIVSLSESSLENDLLSMFNSFIEKYDNGTKLNKFEDIQSYILNKFVSSKESSALKTDIKNVITELLNKSNNNESKVSNFEKEEAITLNKIGSKEFLKNNLDKKNVNSDVVVEKDISKGKQNVVPVKIVGSEVSKDNSDSSKNNLNSESDEKLLNDLISNDKDKGNKLNRVTTFMSQLNKVQDNAVMTVEDKVLVNKTNFVNDVIKAVKYMEINNIKDLTVKVAPKELGEIVIKLTMESGVMKANLSAANKETANILNLNLDELNSKLNNTDIKIQNFTVDIYNGDTAFFKKESDQNQQHHQNGKNSSIDKTDFTEETADVDSVEEQGNVNILA